MTHPSPIRRGVTLLELMLVMAILVVFAAVLAPRFTDFFPSLQVDRTARTVLAWAKKARADAALTGARQRLVFDFEKRRYWIEYQKDPLRNPDAFVRRVGAWKEETYPEGVTLEPLEGLEPVEGRSLLEFFPDGTTQPSAGQHQAVIRTTKQTNLRMSI